MIFTPHNYQRYCIQRMLQEPALALFLGMGLGKTVTTLTVLNDLKYNRFQMQKCLVIAPKKVAEDTWSREQAKWEHLRLLRVVPVLGSLQKRIRALASPGDVYVINRENVTWLVDYYRNDWPFDTVVIDESSSFKSHQAKRFKSLRSIRGHIRRLYELTGTPASNGYMDLWAQIFLLDGGKRLGRTITEYRNQYFIPGKRNATTVFSYEPREGVEEQIQERIRDICISLSAEDYLELPERLDNTRYIKLDGKAQKAYDEMEKQRILEELREETRTIILYEAPHRLVRTLGEILEVLGDRRITLCRELTKKYEEVWQTTIGEALKRYGAEEPKGECVLVIEGKSFDEKDEEKKQAWEKMSIEEHVAFYENAGVERKEAMRMAAKDRGIRKRDVYQR